MPSGMGVNWAGGDDFNYGDMLNGGGGGIPSIGQNPASYVPAQAWGVGGYLGASSDIAARNQQLPFEQARFDQSINERNMALEAKYGRQNMYAQMLMQMLGNAGAYSNLATNKQITAGQEHLRPSYENALQGSKTGGISDDEFNSGIYDARDRVIQQGRANQAAIQSALAQRGITSPLAGAIMGQRAQFESGRAAGQARTSMNQARQSGRISYSGMLGDMAQSQADLATRPTMEGSMEGISGLIGMMPGGKKIADKLMPGPDGSLPLRDKAKKPKYNPENY